MRKPRISRRFPLILGSISLTAAVCDRRGLLRRQEAMPGPFARRLGRDRHRPGRHTPRRAGPSYTRLNPVPMQVADRVMFVITVVGIHPNITT